MNIDFTGRKAIICGGSRGIGRAIALGLAESGAAVSICARGAETLEQTRKEVAAFGHTAHAAPVDLADAAAIRAYITEAAAALGGIDILVNNASAFGSTDDEAGWVSSLAIDMLAIVHATQVALPFLTESKGCVINTSSISALRSAARQPPYGAIKAAVIHYTNTQAAMYAKSGIRVNGIAPGSIEFPGGVWDRRKKEGSPLYNAVLRSIPFGRLGHPEEVANVAMFLASPLASWVTGQTITVDGGQLL
ncbi:SDR family NAD(P)-dependent oxidoreductase [Rhodopila sp.]|uniref:SDR family NAD(P)-dependent oxidoreductase n=1 Tax=Rhodopila sp. TaxID=2480087 RepID=UPI002BE29F56|nr:SDR family oxidoreductase [Rhodopila sp.]HVZ08640.1 SDR family oxidoreductase [Rhodopila sp.]